MQLTYTTNGHEKDCVRTKESQERCGAGDDLPRNTQGGHDGAEDLATDDVDVLREESANVSTNRERVGANVSGNYRYNHRLNMKIISNSHERGSENYL